MTDPMLTLHGSILEARCLSSLAVDVDVVKGQVPRRIRSTLQPTGSASVAT